MAGSEHHRAEMGDEAVAVDQVECDARWLASVDDLGAFEREVQRGGDARGDGQGPVAKRVTHAECA